MEAIEITDIIQMAGGVRHVATELNLDPNSVRRWPKNKVGIPDKYWLSIASLGKKAGLTIAVIKSVHDRARKQ